MAAAFPPPASARDYQRHRPETTALYEVVRDNLETLYGAIGDGALAVRIPKHARKELLAYLDCGLLCRGFARLRCGECGESRLVAFSCKGRGFCPSCLGRRMSATAANLMERVLPETGLRQWVLTSPFPWRRRLAQDGALFGQLARIFVETVQAFYACRAAREGALSAQTGTVTVAQQPRKAPERAPQACGLTRESPSYYLRSGAMTGRDLINMVRSTMEWVDIRLVLYTHEAVGGADEARQQHGADELVIKGAGSAEALVNRVIQLFQQRKG